MPSLVSRRCGQRGRCAASRSRPMAALDLYHQIDRAHVDRPRTTRRQRAQVAGLEQVFNLGAPCWPATVVRAHQLLAGDPFARRPCSARRLLIKVVSSMHRIVRPGGDESSPDHCATGLASRAARLLKGVSPSPPCLSTGVCTLTTSCFGVPHRRPCRPVLDGDRLQILVDGFGNRF